MSNKRMAIVGLAAVLLASCNSAARESGESSSGATPINTVQVERMTAFATVQAVDLAAGTLTLRWSDTLRVNTYRAGPNVGDLSQFQVGDIVKASVAEELAVYIGPDAASPTSSGGSDVRLVPTSDSSAFVLAHTYVITERITAIDSVNRTVTVQPPNSGPRTLKLTPTLDISKLHVGDDVVMRVSEAIAMVVEEQ